MVAKNNPYKHWTKYVVDLRGFEPLASPMPWARSTD